MINGSDLSSPGVQIIVLVKLPICCDDYLASIKALYPTFIWQGPLQHKMPLLIMLSERGICRNVQSSVNNNYAVLRCSESKRQMQRQDSYDLINYW
jgi:hypothetical protein